MSTQKKGKLIVQICIAAVALASAILLAMSLGDKEEGSRNAVVDSETQDWDLNEEVDKGVGDISILGYGTMVMKAGQKQQKVDMGNPKENDCYFRITLLLEDGTRLYQSDLIEPGKGFQKIELEKTLEEGTYAAVIRYDCYSYDEKQENLNGAESGFTLDVRG